MAEHKAAHRPIRAEAALHWPCLPARRSTVTPIHAARLGEHFRGQRVGPALNCLASALSGRI
eukprot:7134064-Karenia_brevis.AAC.1